MKITNARAKNKSFATEGSSSTVVIITLSEKSCPDSSSSMSLATSSVHRNALDMIPLTMQP